MHAFRIFPYLPGFQPAQGEDFFSVFTAVKSQERFFCHGVLLQVVGKESSFCIKEMANDGIIRYTIRVKTLLKAAFLSSLFLYLSCAGIPVREGEVRPSVWTNVEEGVELFHYTDEGSGVTINAVKIDLANSKREVVVSRGIREAGNVQDRESNFISTTAKRFIKKEGLLVAVNGTPFDPYRFFPGQKQRAVGIVVSNGVLYSKPRHYSAIFFDNNNRAQVLDPPFPGLQTYKNVVSGFFTVLRDGKILVCESGRDIRSLVGTDTTGKILYLAVIDRKSPMFTPSSKRGVTFGEAAWWMKFLGADDALLLDGGGSSVIALRNRDTDEVRVLNSPEGGSLLFFKRIAPVFLGIK